MKSQLDASRAGIPRRPRLGRFAAFGLTAAAGAALAGCGAFGGNQNSDAPVVIDKGPAYPHGPCLGTCTLDPGSKPVDCSEANALEKFTILSFDDQDLRSGNYIAEDMYSYTDATAQVLFEYGQKGQTPQLSRAGWQPPTQEVDLCSSGSHPNHVLHIVGGFNPPPHDANGNPVPGPWLANLVTAADPPTLPGQPDYTFVPAPLIGWGGGVGIAMQKLNSRDAANPTKPDSTRGDSQKNLCGKDTPAAVCPPVDAEYAVAIAALDVSTYDGVSFWARRGPDGETGLRINVGDKHTDDDISYLTYAHDPSAPRYCERIRECACLNHKPCQFADHPPETFVSAGVRDQPGYFCLPPDPVAYRSISGAGSNVFCNPIGTPVGDTSISNQCDEPYPAYPNDMPDGTVDPNSTLAGDRQFFGKPCTPYSWPDGVRSDFCFDPAKDPPPAPTSEQCGDHWMTTVHLSTDWQFFKIPFTDLRQQGFAKKFEQIDLHAVSVVRFTWDAGWVDFWIDDVSFYREPNKK